MMDDLPNNFKFIKEEEFFAKNCSIELYNLIEHVLQDDGIPRSNKTLSFWLGPVFEYTAWTPDEYLKDPVVPDPSSELKPGRDFWSPTHKTILKLNLSPTIIRPFIMFYKTPVFGKLTKTVSITKLKGTPTLVFTNPSNHSVKIVPTSDKQKIIQLFEEYLKYFIKIALITELTPEKLKKNQDQFFLELKFK